MVRKKLKAECGEDLYSSDHLSAFDAISWAQKIAFAPVLFQAALSLRELGILEFLDRLSPQGAALGQIAGHAGLDEDAAGVLVDMGLSAGIIYRTDGLYHITKAGIYLQNDPMTRVNMDFVNDVCYQGLAYLADSLKTRQPQGLKVFGSGWTTIYPHLQELPERARRSWFAFDHFYSDACFRAAVPHLLALKPEHIYDLGGNTGKFAVCCCEADPKLRVTILDLPSQVEAAARNIRARALEGRVDFLAVDVLDEQQQYPQAGPRELWWMSQFLDCFEGPRVVKILTALCRSMSRESRICIMEPFWDHQKFEAISYSLNASSLYFTAMANGKSRFFSRERFREYLEAAGLEAENTVDGLGICHTLLICAKKPE